MGGEGLIGTVDVRRSWWRLRSCRSIRGIHDRRGEGREEGLGSCSPPPPTHHLNACVSFSYAVCRISYAPGTD